MERLVLVFVVIVGATMAVIPIQIESFTCEGNEDYCQNLTCSMETIRSKMQVLNLDCNISKKLDNLMIQFTLFKKEGSKYKHFMINSTEDLCKLLGKSERSNLVSRLLPMWKYYGRFPMSCPVQGEVSLHRYPLDLSFYPSVFPSGHFKITVRIFESKNNTSILNASNRFSVKYT